MKNTCPKCGKEAQGIVRTKVGKSRILYSFIHLADNEYGYSECSVAVPRKKKTTNSHL